MKETEQRRILHKNDFNPSINQTILILVYNEEQLYPKCKVLSCKLIRSSAASRRPQSENTSPKAGESTDDSALPGCNVITKGS